uniref:Uncharacterized protein n=1 Tax=Timema cristinae TaxID=61476 RepID=A0A7R9D874_TIMCR|nr:unnamed protein product [Timema cristinae]
MSSLNLVTANISKRNPDIKNPERRKSRSETLPGFEQCDELDAREWFESDGNDPGYQHLNDDEIVHQVIEDNDNGSNVRERVTTLKKQPVLHTQTLMKHSSREAT